MVRKRKTPTIQIVVRRGALRRFASLNEKRGELPVALLWDRRISDRDRRTDSAQSAGERRVQERRREPPFTWTTAEFLVIETQAEPEKPRKKPAVGAKSTARKKTVKKR